MKDKKLNIFISILYFIGVLALFLVITCTPVDAATLKNSTDNYLVNYKMSSYNELFSYWSSTDANGSGGSIADSGFNLKPNVLPNSITINSDNDRFHWPIKLFKQRGNSYFDYLYLNSYNIRPYISNSDNPNLSNWCNPSINANGCTFDIGFSVIWDFSIPNDTPNFDLSLQQSISYILNNYNKARFSYYYYTDNQNNIDSISVPLNTKVIQSYQVEEEGTTYYTLNVYYTQKLYNFAGFSTGKTRPAGDNDFYYNNGGFYFETSEYDSYTTYLLFHDNDLYWNTSLEFNDFYYAYSNSSNGGSNSDITGEDSSKDEILRQQEETNRKLEDIYAKINDTSPPDTSGLGGSAGWLPAGPVDSIINLPLTFFQGLNNAMATSCSPVNVPLPFVNQNVQLPCVNTLFNQINGFNTWWNAMGLIAAAFILYKYLIHLYQWVDNTLTFRENNWQDWGGI